MPIKLSEQVRRLEDTIENLRAENKRLRDNWNTPDVRDEIIDHQKRDIEKLKKELWARVKQVEDLQSSYKTLQKENERLKSKLADKKKLESDKYEFIDDDWMINPKNFLDYLDKHFF